MSFFRLLIILLFPFIIACGGGEAQPSTNEIPAAVIKVDTFVTMTPTQARYLFDNATKIDVLFTNLPVSLSQVKQSDVQGQVSFMGPGPVPKNLNCPETANIIYQADGEIIGDGKMYIEGDCHFIVFYEKDKPPFAAYMNEQGMKFYTQILSSRPQVPTE